MYLYVLDFIYTFTSTFVYVWQIEKDKAVYVNKGTNSHIDSYSAFWDNKKLSQTPLLKKLTEQGVTDVYVCGLAYDICVGECRIRRVRNRGRIYCTSGSV